MSEQLVNIFEHVIKRANIKMETQKTGTHAHSSGIRMCQIDKQRPKNQVPNVYVC